MGFKLMLPKAKTVVASFVFFWSEITVIIYK